MNSLDTHEDAVLISRSLAGDEAAFREIVRRYQGPVYACTRAITRSDADAKDAAQEAFIRLYRHLDQVDPGRPLKPYLLRIAANCAKTLLGKRVREVTGVESERVPASGPSPATGIARRERRAAVRDLVDALPTTLRQVCSLFYLGDCSCREVAATLDMSEGAVKVALHRARKHLRADLESWRAMP